LRSARRVEGVELLQVASNRQVRTAKDSGREGSYGGRGFQDSRIRLAGKHSDVSTLATTNDGEVMARGKRQEQIAACLLLHGVCGEMQATQKERGRGQDLDRYAGWACPIGAGWGWQEEAGNLHPRDGIWPGLFTFASRRIG